MQEQEKNKIIQAGKIASEIKIYAKEITKKDTPLIEIADKIENKIFELGAKPAFPVNLSINEVAAHYTPSYNDETLAHGLIKIDIGVSVDGFIADTSFSLDLENSKENQNLIQATEKALEKALEIIKENSLTSEIGKTIQETIQAHDLNPIINLTGHSIEQYDLHSGISIPNIDNKQNTKIIQGLYAIEPFATKGSGKVYEGKPSGIYILQSNKNTRNPLEREVLQIIKTKYSTLPFCSRWLVKDLGTKSLTALESLEKQGIIHQFPQLIESTKQKVSQAEHTILIDNEKTVTTK